MAKPPALHSETEPVDRSDGPVESADWQPIAELCAAVAADLPGLVPGIADVIRREVPEYAVVPRVAHEIGIAEQYRGLLTGLASRRGPSREEHERAKALGQRRAGEGLPAQALISAYHVGYREMWNVLLSRANDGDARSSGRLVCLVGPVWSWVQEASSAAVQAFGDAVRAEDAAQLGLAYRFLNALYAPPSARGEVAHLARALAFDPTGEFQAVCAPASAWTDDQLIAMRRRFAGGPGVVRCVGHGSSMTVMTQGLSAGALVAAMAEANPGTPVGIGLRRPGTDGAAASLVDAEEALDLAGELGGTVAFEHQWMLATLVPRGGRLIPLLKRGREVAADHPDLASAVHTFADNGFSLTAASRVMHLHANTVKYRLDRWQQLTGWDVHTWEGLSSSKVALGLPAPPADTSG
ncbi:helix-turn-helix domain-containing protein [Streptomyces sp. AK02-01A]|uniref:PucR family transcriptional regulator n=1 Tax=Streptomyces sp. AK02-01A TaxID=3028648 RepID=UPI0029BD6118|nr:helix-turn-helix domain-containing protein [Streptomyces sp. AK02-01A]MDX3853722.1 helix-turn-helix domain-containing protein [Streptomyces sp. AK02-01A]